MTGTRQDPCPHAPSLNPSSFRLRAFNTKQTVTYCHGGRWWWRHHSAQFQQQRPQERPVCFNGQDVLRDVWKSRCLQPTDLSPKTPPKINCVWFCRQNFQSSTRFAWTPKNKSQRDENKQCRSCSTHCPTQSIIYVPLLVYVFHKSIWLIVQSRVKYLKSCSKDFKVQDLILRTSVCGTGFVPQHCWVVDFHLTILVRCKCFERFFWTVSIDQHVRRDGTSHRHKYTCNF